MPALVSSVTGRKVARFILGAALTLLAFASKGQTEMPDARLVGVADADVSGQATYRIPLEFPKGANGLDPNFALVYSHRMGGGLFGVGWTLAGLSRIERCVHTFAQDSTAREVKLDSEDRLCVDGNKLRRLGTGTYWQGGAQYRAEVDDYTRFTAVDSGGILFSSFRAERKDGLIYTYGGTSDSRRLAPGTSVPYAWLISRISDRSGNYIDFQYSAAGSSVTEEARPLEIRYTGNSSASRGAPYVIKFEYGGQSSGPARWIAGGQLTHDLRVLSIRLEFDSQEVLRYYFGYESSMATVRSRLSSLRRCGDGICTGNTTFTYRNGTRGWDSVSAGAAGIAAPAFAFATDLNEDGLDDLVFSNHTQSGSGHWSFMLASLSSSTGYGPIQVTSNGNHFYDRAILGDINGDGTMEVLVPCQSGSSWCVMYGNRFSGLGVMQELPIGAGPIGAAWVADVNGDGLLDWVTADSRWIYVRLRTGSQNPPQWAAPVTYGVLNSPTLTFVGDMFGPYGTWSRSGVRKTDFNGDGRADLLLSALDGTTPVWVVFLSDQTSGQPQYRQAEVISGSPAGTHPVLLDIDGDGKSDLLFVTDSSGSTTLRFGTTSGLGASRPGPSLAGMDLNSLAVTDWDGDGRHDLLARPASGSWHVFRSNGRFLESAVATSIPGSGALATTRISDANGDGLLDVGYAVGSTWHTHRHSGATPDLLQIVTDGLGNTVELTYAPLTNTGVYRKYYDSDEISFYPIPNYSGSMQVVQSLKESTGGGLFRNRSFQYVGGKVDLRGRGFQGFETRTTRMSRNSGRPFLKTEEFSQTFPTAGLILYQTVYLETSPVSTLVAHRSYQYSSIWEGATGQRYAFTYPSQISKTESSPFPRSITHTIAMTAGSYGTPTSVQVRTAEGTAANGIYPAAQLVEQVSNSDWHNDTNTWCVGRPLSSSITRSHTVMPDGDPITRASARSWDDRCRLASHTLAPNTSHALTTVLAYDDFGNVNSITESGLNAQQVMESRQTTLEWDPFGEFGVRGYFLTKVTNPLAQVTGYRWQINRGLLREHIDRNGLATTWAYDGLGRRTSELRPDGTRTERTYAACDAECIGVAYAKLGVRTRDLDTTGSILSERLQLFDSLERELRASRRLSGGGFSHILTEYEGRGLVARVSAPHWTGAAPYWTNYTYGNLDRVTRIERPISDSDPTLQFTSISYNGLTQAVVDAEGRYSALIRNVAGEVVRSVNHLSQGVTYVYNAFQELTETADAAGNRIILAYDPDRGFRISTSDPDMGTWQYAHSAFGELRWQQDAKSQPTTFKYDKLGRPLTRTEPEGDTRWYWDTAAHAVGQLGSVTSAGSYSESYLYDTLGRLSQTTVVADGDSYQINQSYSGTAGWLETLTYPTSTSGVRVKLRYNYQDAILQSVQDYTNNVAGAVYWQANTIDAAGQVIDEQLGNGLRTITSFDSVTGWINDRSTGPGGGSARQNLMYVWNKAGHLTQRQDLNLGLTETFTYDDLYRLTTVQRNGSQTLAVSYDAIGNISSKSDVGSFAYHATKKHAVTTAGANTYTYDANGNVATRSGATITWASYNLPTRINQSGGSSSQFAYGADRSRYKQISYDGSSTQTTIYVKGLFEKLTRGAVTEYEHNIAAPSGTVAVHNRKSSGTNETVYLLKDHLGSVDAITNASGAQLARLSYDALGKRRNGATWSGAPSSSDLTTIGDTTRAGYTEHEHLDNLTLVHMNGRVYDPTIGRFMSADPFVPEPYNAQSLNRYSYVFNSPLSYTDPSGYDPTGCSFWCASAIATVASWAGGLLGGDDPPPRPPWDYTPATPDAAPPSASQSVADSTVGGAGQLSFNDYVTLLGSGYYERGGVDIGQGMTLMVPTRIYASSDPNAAAGLHRAQETLGYVAAGILLGVPGPEDAAIVGALAVRGTTALVRVGDRLTTVFDLLKNPSLLAGKSPAEIQMILGRTPGWRRETLGRGSHAGQGYVLREYNAAGNPTGRMIQWHPGGGHHGPNPYWRVRSPEGGISDIISGGVP